MTAPRNTGSHDRRATHGVRRIDYDGAFWFPVRPDELWGTIEHFERFESWWDWLQEFGADSATLAAGNVLHATVVPPVPVRLRLDIRLASTRRPREIEAVLGGDVDGTALLRFAPDRGGTRVTAAWSLGMVSRPLRLAALLAYPLMRWGHDQVVEMAVAGFRRRALASAATQARPPAG